MCTLVWFYGTNKREKKNSNATWFGNGNGFVAPIGQLRTERDGDTEKGCQNLLYIRRLLMMMMMMMMMIPFYHLTFKLTVCCYTFRVKVLVIKLCPCVFQGQRIRLTQLPDTWNWCSFCLRLRLYSDNYIFLFYFTTWNQPDSQGKCSIKCVEIHGKLTDTVWKICTETPWPVSVSHERKLIE